MKTGFLSLKTKRVLWDKLDAGDKAASKFVMDELERLEAIIRNHEHAMKSISDYYKDEFLKKEPLASF